MKYLILILAILLLSCEKEKQDMKPTIGSINIVILETSPQPSGSISNASTMIFFHSSDWDGQCLKKDLAPGIYSVFLNHLQIGNETINNVEVKAGETTEIKPTKF